MTFNVSDFTAALRYGGARPTLFRVNLVNPINGGADALVPFLCKASSLPASTMGTIELPYFGRKIKLAGDRTYAEWQVTIINDEDFSIRDAMEEWSHAINTPEGNLRLSGGAPSSYRSDAFVTQYSKSDVPVREYKVVNLWPSEVSSIELGWETNDTVEEYTVTFQYDYWIVSGGNTGNAGGQ